MDINNVLCAQQHLQYDNFGSQCMLKIESSNYLMMAQHSVLSDDDATSEMFQTQYNRSVWMYPAGDETDSVARIFIYIYWSHFICLEINLVPHLKKRFCQVHLISISPKPTESAEMICYTSQKYLNCFIS
jgi:hypothetical protein